MPAAATMWSAFAATVLVGIWKLLLLVILHTTREREWEEQQMSPRLFTHTPFVLGEQWFKNRKPPEGYGRRGRRPTHHMGYAIDVHGNYMYDETGNYMLGPGVQYALDQDGVSYLQDAEGNYMLQDEAGTLIEDGYGDNGYGGFGPDANAYDYVRSASDDNVTAMLVPLKQPEQAKPRTFSPLLSARPLSLRARLGSSS